MKRLATVVGALTALALGMGASIVLAAPNDGGSGSPGVGRIGICHKTGNSQAHPFVYITPDASGVLDGHGKVSHQSGDDILPAFSFVNAQGQTVAFPGQNLSTVYSGSTGADLVANGCESGANTTTDTTPEL